MQGEEMYEEIETFYLPCIVQWVWTRCRGKLGLMKTASHLLVNFSMGYTFDCLLYNLSPSRGSCAV